MSEDKMGIVEGELASAESEQTAQDFIDTIAPMTAGTRQAQILSDLGPITRHDTVLEIWCGGGDLTSLISAFAGRVIGADYSRKLVDAARVRFPHIEFVQSGMVELPFEDGSIDIVVSNATAHHFSEPVKNFTEARRVLRAGGLLLITIPIQSSRIGFNLVLNAARAHLQLPDRVVTGGPLIDAEEPEAVIGALQEAGFSDCDGGVRSSVTVVKSVDTVLDYAWKKIGLEKAAVDVQAAIRSSAIRDMEPYRTSDGYRFPEQLLAIRGRR